MSAFVPLTTVQPPHLRQDGITTLQREENVASRTITVTGNGNSIEYKLESQIPHVISLELVHAVVPNGDNDLYCAINVNEFISNTTMGFSSTGVTESSVLSNAFCVLPQATDVNEAGFFKFIKGMNRPYIMRNRDEKLNRLVVSMLGPDGAGIANGNFMLTFEVKYRT